MILKSIFCANQRHNPIYRIYRGIGDIYNTSFMECNPHNVEPAGHMRNVQAATKQTQR